VPGLPDDVCGADAACIGLNGDVTICAKTCTDASACADGYACTDDDGDPSTAKICFPVCSSDSDCRASETCKGASPTTPGTCVAS
jgi:hypothetical protein